METNYSGVVTSTSRFHDGDDFESSKTGSFPSAPASTQGRRPRALKLTEITKQLTPQANESLARSALQRVLKAERTAMLGGVAAIRQKIIASLAALFSEDFKDRKCLFAYIWLASKCIFRMKSLVVVEYIMADPRSRIELAFSWLYEEYSMVMGFSQQPSSIKEEFQQRTLENYTSVFCSLVDQLNRQVDLKERET